MKPVRYWLFALLLALVLLSATSSDVFARGKEFWADSVYNKALCNEGTLQYYLDSLGYNIDVANDELGWDVFCGLDGVNTASMVIEVAGSAVWATSGYYKAGDTSIFYQLFGPSNVPGDSVQFTFAAFDSIGFYMKPNLPNEQNTWLTEEYLNWDGYDHAWVFSTGVPHEYLICWEDLPNGGDEDYQDLVIRVTFANDPPELTLPDTTIITCSAGSVCFDIIANDPNCESDSVWLEMLSGEGTFAPDSGISTINATHCFTPSGGGLYEFVFRAEDILGAYTIDTAYVQITTGTAPEVVLDDTTLSLCEPAQVCLPVSILDPECDITSVTTNYGSYTGTIDNYDQVDRINQLGGSITQIGGGSPGKVLHSASDFVPPVNSQSGVSVTMPDFVFADHVINYGPFPHGTTPANSADHMLGAPTDITFTSPGPGGPDGGNGDGSVSFSPGNRCRLGFPQVITTCNGSNSDFVIFTNTDCGGTAKLWFKLNGAVVLSKTVSIPGGTASSGIGGVTLDLPDGLTYNQVKIKCLNGNLEIDAFAARVTPSSTSNDVCFDADTSGIYEIIVTATDSCGNVGADTAQVTVNMNSAPVADAGDDFTAFLCDYSEICFNVGFSDIDNNIALTEKTQGPGTLTGNQICFTPTTTGALTFIIHAVDSCGEEDYDTVVVTIDTNDPPIADDPNPVTMFMCEAVELCHDFTATDPNGGSLTWTHIGGAGSITPDGHFCFTPTASGTYGAAVVVSDSCGAVDTTTIQYDITLNSAPVAVDPGTPVDQFLCQSEEICYQFTANDTEGGVLLWNKLSGDGTITDNGNWCFTPTATGSYTITATVTDSCGLADTVSHTYNVTVNDAPSVAFGNDTTLLLCAVQEICVGYTPSDPQGLNGLVETMISGYGSIDTASDKICFTPTADGAYEFVVGVTDSCGETDVDTVLVTVTFGEVAQINCPTPPIDVFLCGPDTVCHLLDITPATATVTTSYGTYDNGQLCFMADTAGTYVITVIASESCGADTCQITFNVDIGTAAEITCPDPQDIFLCSPDSVCLPVGVNGTNVNVTVTPIGTYNSGNVCFPADTSGHYEIHVNAVTSCGSDSCTIIADITLNSPPIATDPTSPVDTFLCNTAQICYQFDATDVDGGALTWSRLSGNGTVDASGQWCFDANTAGTYSVTAAVTDSCGAADTVTMTYNVTINTPPALSLGDDTTLFMCQAGIACWYYTLTDPDNNVDIVEIISGDPSGSIDQAQGKLCFVPSIEGTYEFIVRVTDSCGAQDIDTINFTVDINEAPVVDAGADQTIFQCTATELCWPASVTDADGNLVGSELVSGPGTFDGSQICFTPTGTYDYEFVLKGTDNCGLETFDTVVVYYTLNTPPVADAGADQTVFQCQPTEISWAASCTDAEGNLSSCALIEGPGMYDGSQISFTPGASGSYLFILQADDACGESDIDSVTINVTINSDPVCVVPNDTAIFQCTAQEVCLPAYATDIDGNLKVCQITSGPGSLINGNWCYTPVSDQAVTVTVSCEDSCGAVCESQFTVEFNINGAPQISFGADTTIFQCAAEEICLPYISNDPDDPRTTTTTLVSGNGSLNEDSSWVCFTPTGAGTYTFILRIDDECGEYDEDTINVDVSLNSPPVADAGADQVLFLCDSLTEVCWPASCSDVDGNLTDCLFNGPGTYDGSQICFIPVATGQYTFTLHAFDDCGEEMIDTVTIDVTIDSDPVIAFGADTSLLLCAPQEICLDYTVDDPDGMAGLTELMVSGYGAIDTAANKVCFTPTADGVYEFIVSATDTCGKAGLDTIVVTVTFGESASIDCPTGPVSEFLCTADSIAYTLAITPASATVDVSYGIYDNGVLRFYADTAGSYVITVIASTYCGVDTCEITFDVGFNSPPVADAGSDQSIFQCAPSEICWSASCSDPDNNLTTCELESGPGTYNGSNICFTPSGSGSYQFVLKATDACGEIDRDTVTIDVTINSAPTVAAQNDTSLFLCAPQQVCVSYTPNDADGLTGLVETMLSGFGSIDTANNVMCFTPTTAGSYEFIVQATDSCGENDEDTVVVAITFGETAIIDCPTDTISVSLCDTATVCALLDIQPSSATVTTSYGTYANGELCIFADTSGVYVVEVIASEACGADTCQVIFNVDIGQVADISCPPQQDVFVCDTGEEVCIPVTVMTPGATISVSPIGYYNAGNVCFPADSSGHYELTITATTSCGSDSCDIIADVTINSSPVADNPTTPVDTFLCDPAQICYQFAATDADNGSMNWSKLTGVGSVSASGEWCFDANADGSYSVTAAVTDSCNDADTVTLTYNVDINSAPSIALGSDTSISICDGDNYCFTYTVSDDDNNITIEELLSPTGTIDTATNEVCFTPTASGSYQFIVQTTDACGEIDSDTMEIAVDLGTAVVLTCPADTAMFLCAPQQICRPVGVSLSGATVTVSPIGSYDAGSGEVCFDADTAGQYIIEVIATSTCGADTCQFTVDVTMNSNPVAVDPQTPVDTFMCAPAQVCYQFSATDPDGGSVTWSRLSGPGTVDASGLWCFTPTSAGSYAVEAVATDSCGASDTTALTYNITLNSPPAMAHDTDLTFFLCASNEICINYYTSDVDNNITLEEIISGVGVIDTIAKTVCFTPDTAGIYQFITQVTDACGETDVDTINAAVTINVAPVANAGNDQTLFQCAPDEICWSAGCSDANGNLDSCYLVSGIGSYDGSQICFTPDTAGTYTFILKAVDACGLTDEDTVLIVVDLNEPPVCQVPNDSTFFQCVPTMVSLPISATDPDNNYDHCEIVTGPGSIVGGNWVYTPTTDQAVVVSIMCLDSCGALCEDSFAVSFDINAAPVVDLGADTTYFLCNAQTLCWPVTISDEDNNLDTAEVLSPAGAYLNGTYDNLCLNVPAVDTTYMFVVRATDTCGAFTYDTTFVTLDFNSPPTLGLPPDFTAYLDVVGEVCFDIEPNDPDGNLSGITVSPIGTYDSNSDQICFTADSTGTYCFEITATDACGEQVSDSICVEIVIDECLHVQIEKTHNSYQGSTELVHIYQHGSGKEIGGFDMLVAYDATALTINTVVPGSLLEDCGWEYFTFRQGANGNCGSGCPSGLLRIVAIAETNNGANHPGCFLDGMIGALATIEVLVTNDRTFECQYAPMQFFWMDCNDNTFSSKMGDTLWISRNVFDFELNDITDNSAVFPTFFGDPDFCLEGGGPGKPAPIRCIDFTNGGIDIACADSIDARGDLNLNGVANEIADAVLYSNYFVHGLGVFNINVQGQTAASDVNADGIPLSVGDLVYLVRVIAGDALPYPKLDPNRTYEVDLSINDDILTIVDSDYQIGAIFLTLEGKAEPILHDDAANMDMRYSFDGSVTRVLICNLNGKAYLEDGNVLKLNGNHKIKDIEIGSYDGFNLKAKINNLPDHFALSQNYPNPFNPTTTIEFALPVKTDWNLTIYNILGQEVDHFNGTDDAGYMKIEWDAGDYASGVYFYRLRAGDFSESKKMILLK